MQCFLQVGGDKSYAAGLNQSVPQASRLFVHDGQHPHPLDDELRDRLRLVQLQRFTFRRDSGCLVSRSNMMEVREGGKS